MVSVRTLQNGVNCHVKVPRLSARAIPFPESIQEINTTAHDDHRELTMRILLGGRLNVIDAPHQWLDPRS
jgi:hypothetical protein